MTKAKFIFDRNAGFNQVKIGDDIDSTITANVDSVSLDIADITLNGNVTVNGVITALDGAIKLRDIQEITTPIVDATGATTHDAALARIFVHSSIDGAFTANFTNVGLTSGYATTLTLVLVQGATPRVPTMGTIDGNAVTFSWQGNVTPLGTASRTDVVTFSVINSGGTYLVYGQLVSF